MFYSKKGPARFNSHLDMVRTLERSMRRAGLPIAYSEGFNPHPRFSFAAPLPVGVEGLAEPFDVEMLEPVENNVIEEKLNAVLPDGIRVHGVATVPDNEPSLMSVLDRAKYIVHIDEEDLPFELPDSAVEDFLSLEHVEVLRKDKLRDIRPGILKIQKVQGDSGLTLNLELKAGSVINIRPEDALDALFKNAGIETDKEDFQITRTALST